MANPKKSSIGAHLDPRRVLDALAADMPLALAADTLAAMTRTALHRRRSGAIQRALHRACHLAAAAERAEVRNLVLSLFRVIRLISMRCTAPAASPPRPSAPRRVPSCCARI